MILAQCQRHQLSVASSSQKTRLCKSIIQRISKLCRRCSEQRKICESYVTRGILQCCAIIVFIWTSTLKLNYDPTSQCAYVTRFIKFGPCIIDLSGFSNLLHQKKNKIERKATIDWLSFCFNFWSAFLAVFKHVMSFITVVCKRAIKR